MRVCSPLPAQIHNPAGSISSHQWAFRRIATSCLIAVTGYWSMAPSPRSLPQSEGYYRKRGGLVAIRICDHPPCGVLDCQRWEIMARVAIIKTHIARANISLRVVSMSRLRRFERVADRGVRKRLRRYLLIGTLLFGSILWSSIGGAGASADLPRSSQNKSWFQTCGWRYLASRLCLLWRSSISGRSRWCVNAANISLPTFSSLCCLPSVRTIVYAHNRERGPNWRGARHSTCR